MKGSGCGGDFNGPTIKKIIHSEKKLNDLLVSVSGSKPFVKTLRSMARLHTLVSARHLDPKYEDIIWDFAMDWHNLYKEFGLSHTLKIHIIRDHLADRLRQSGETLVDESDEHTEQAHHRVKEFCQTHQYQCSYRQIGSFLQGKKQHSMFVHLNSANI